jgi:hypothetical protein
MSFSGLVCARLCVGCGVKCPRLCATVWDALAPESILRLPRGEVLRHVWFQGWTGHRLVLTASLIAIKVQNATWQGLLRRSLCVLCFRGVYALLVLMLPCHP